MARIPTELDLGQRPIPSPQRGIYAPQNGQAAQAAEYGAKVLGAVGERITGAANEANNAASNLQAAQAASMLYQARSAAQRAAQESNDPDQAENIYQQQMQEALKQSAGYIQDGNKRALFVANAGEHINVGLNSVASWASGRRRENAQASVLQTNTTNLQAALSDEKSFGNLRAINRDGNKYARIAGLITAEQEFALNNRFDNDYADNFYKQMIASGKASDVVKMLSPSFTSDDNALLQKISMVESGGNPAAVNKQSGAAGLFQFMPETAKQYGLSEADRLDPEKSMSAAAALLRDNRRGLQSNLGRDPTDGELYLAHQQGAMGAAKLLSNPSALAVDVVGKQAVLQNGGTAEMTAAEFAKKWTQKFDAPGIAGILPAEKRLELLKSAEVAISVEDRMAERVKKQQQQDVMGSMMDKAYRDQLTVADIIADKVLEPNQKENMLSMLQKAVSGEGRTNPKVFNDLFQRIHAKAEDPQRITDPQDLIQYVGNGLGMGDLDKLRKEISGRGTPDGEAETMLKKQFFNMAKDKISGENSLLGRKDPKGEELNLQFMAQAMSLYNEGRKTGKTAPQLLDPKSPDYVGKTINNFVRPMSEQYADLVSANDMSAASMDFNNPQDLIDAVNSGKLSRQEGEALALNKGWIKKADNAPKVPMGDK